MLSSGARFQSLVTLELETDRVYEPLAQLLRLFPHADPHLVLP